LLRQLQQVLLLLLLFLPDPWLWHFDFSLHLCDALQLGFCAS
jgi:hypothetical protein